MPASVGAENAGRRVGALSVTRRSSPNPHNGTLCETPAAHAQAREHVLIAEQRRISNKVCCVNQGKQEAVPRSGRRSIVAPARSFTPSPERSFPFMARSRFQLAALSKSAKRASEGRFIRACLRRLQAAERNGAKAAGQRSGSVAAAEQSEGEQTETDRSQGTSVLAPGGSLRTIGEGTDADAGAS